MKCSCSSLIIRPSFITVLIAAILKALGLCSNTLTLFLQFWRFWQYFTADILSHKIFHGLRQHYTVHNESKHVNNARVSIKWHIFFPPIPKNCFWDASNMERTTKVLQFKISPARLGTDHFTALLTRVKLNVVFACVISLNYGCFIFKTRQRWNYNICFTGIWFSARADARGKTAPKLRSIQPERGFAWYDGPVRVRWDRWPLRSRWSIRAFISETWEEVEDGCPGVRYSDKLPPIQRLAACPPPSLLTSIWSHLYPCPLSASSHSLHFLSEAQV